MLEKDIERTLTRIVKERGGMCFKFVSPARAGVPDRIVLAPGGRVIFVELKAAGGKVSKVQSLQIERMSKLGADVRVLRGLGETILFLNEVFPTHEV